MNSMTKIHLGRSPVFAAILLTVIFSPIHVRADAGDLDLTFNGNGKILLDLPSGFSYAYDLVIESDRRIIAAGTSLSEEGGYDVVLQSGAVIYSAPTADLTKLLLDRLNAKK